MPFALPRTCRCVAGVAFYACLARASYGQVLSQMSEVAGSTVDVTVIMSTCTDFDFLEAEGTATTAVASGSALITLFPDDPPYGFCQVHTLAVVLDPVAFEFAFSGGLIVMNVTITELTIDAPLPFNGAIDSAGVVDFDVAPVRVSGTASVVNTDNFPMNIVQPFEDQLPLAGRMTTQPNGDVILDQVATPPVEVEIDPVTLPIGVDFFELIITLDAAQLALAGPVVPALLGDADADTDVDLADFSVYAACITGQGPIQSVPCTLFDFDNDNDVDLLDWSAFQAAFTGG